MEGAGFEPAKAEPSDLQSDPFGRSGTPPHQKFLPKAPLKEVDKMVPTIRVERMTY